MGALRLIAEFATIAALFAVILGPLQWLGVGLGFGGGP
jgi:hypothetical protein